MKIIERVFQYLEYKCVKPTRFEKNIGLSNGYLGVQLKRSADLGEGVINKIIENCLDLSAIWLITGKGEMLIKEANIEVIQSDVTTCQLCMEKDRLIGSQEDVIGLLKEKIKILEESSPVSTGSAEESGKNDAFRQTA
ncbi:MAG: hypothetical protein ACOYMF_17440 [Bacteroidales bacterium]